MRRTILLLALYGVVAAACGLKVPVSEQTAGELTGAVSGGDGSLAGGADDLAVDVDGAGPDGAAEAAAGGAAQAAEQARRQAEAQAGASSIFPNDTEGLTKTTLKICTHVPITGAAPVDRNPKRFGAFYFDWLNSRGGIHQRKVEYIVYDDRYSPAYAIQAAERCRAAGAFIIAGAAGTDQLVAVAKWARDKKVPYLMGPASVKDVAQYTPYAKMVGPDYEFQHHLLADYLVKEFGTDENYGMIRVASPFFTAARDAYAAALKKHGVELVVDEEVQKDENTFTTICSRLRTNNVRIVNNFTTPVIWLKMMNQCKGYTPTWTAVSPAAGFNLVAEILAGESGQDSGDALVFHHFNPAYPATKTDSGANLDRYPYAAEIRRFQEIFDTCTVCRSEANSGKAPRDDIDWSAYLAAKAIHRFLEKAGPDLTRTKVWTMLDGYKETPQEAAPGCPADFTRAPHRGAWHVNVFKLGTRQWDNVATCVDRA